MKPHLQYLRYVLRHKWFVLVAGRRLHVPILRLILHDWTKFLPSEWLPYVHFFYGPGMSHERAAELGYDFPVPDEVELAFEQAWNHHQKRNDHHYQYWIRIGDDGTVLPLPMSDAARREMIADWQGAGRALGKSDTRAWYEAHKDKMQLHPETRAWVEDEFDFIAQCDRTERAFRAGLYG